jgi:hypothetical protein
MVVMMMIMMYSEMELKNHALKISVIFTISSHIFVDMNFLTGSINFWVLMYNSD